MALRFLRRPRDTVADMTKDKKESRMKPKRGDVRADGRVFWGMNKGREEWRAPEAFAKAAKRSDKDRRLMARTVLDYWKVHMVGGCQAKGCNEKDPVCLSFHHYRGEKLFNIADQMNGNFYKLLREVMKCVVLCHNCHAKMHNQSRPFYELERRVAALPAEEAAKLVKQSMSEIADRVHSK